MKLIDAGEPGSFSMRQLADELGVGVMTLYGYVRDKEELYEAVTAMALDEVTWDPVTDGPWEDEVCSAARELRGVCRRHPNLVSTVLADRNPHPRLFRIRERIFTALHRAGFPSPVALHALRVCSSYALGFAIAETSELGRHLPERLREDHVGESADESGPIGHHPSSLEPDAFEYGLSLLIYSLRAQHADL
jgi:AcrR family transcriptional regulator